MQRRELFRLLGAGAVLPVLSPDLLALFQEAQPKSGYALRTLNPSQNAAVTAMIDVIIPATATPGAKAARVNEFIDLILTEWATEEERRRFLSGLAEVDKSSNSLFAKDFVDCTPPQQEEFLRALDQRLAEEREMHLPHPDRPRTRDAQLQGSFFEVLRRMTLYGYYTSEVGFKLELKDEIIPGSYHGCTPLTNGSKT
jgi:hypothetical protein